MAYSAKTGRYESEGGEFAKVIRAVERLKTKVKTKIDVALKTCAEVILRKSQEYVPVDTETLKKSGRIFEDSKDSLGRGKGLGAKVTVVYTAPYAVYVHENLDVSHKPPTTAKFLERAVAETRGTCASILKREMEAL